MEAIASRILWSQFGAAIDMLDNAVRACPDEVWGDGPTPHAFWYLVYHTLFWLDLYLSGTPAGFAPPSPFSLDELDPAGVYPERVYTKAEMRAYLEHGRRKCRAAIAAMSAERAAEPSGFVRLGLSQGELLVRVTPPKHRPEKLLVRLPLTAGWRVTAAQVDNQVLPLAKDGAVDVVGRQGKFMIRFQVKG